MALTLLQLRARLNHFLGGDPSSEWNVDDLINEAGREFVGSHEWKFMERATTLDFVADQAYVDLPSDFGTMIHLESTSANRYAVCLTDFNHFARLQASGLSGDPGGLYATIIHPDQTATSSAPGSPRLLLWPTPSTSLTDALRIYYRADWLALANDGDVPNLPRYCDTALTQFVDAVARGYEEPDGGSVWDRLERLKASKSFADLVYRSGLVQPNLGPERNGAVMCSPTIDFMSSIPASPS